MFQRKRDRLCFAGVKVDGQGITQHLVLNGLPGDNVCLRNGCHAGILSTVFNLVLHSRWYDERAEQAFQDIQTFDCSKMDQRRRV